MGKKRTHRKRAYHTRHANPSHLTGKSNYARDIKRRAKKPGVRTSASGRRYYERRRNRADANPRRRY